MFPSNSLTVILLRSSTKTCFGGDGESRTRVQQHFPIDFFPSAVDSLNSPKPLESTKLVYGSLLKFPQIAKTTICFVSYKIDTHSLAVGELEIDDAAPRQRMLIHYYQRLYFVMPFSVARHLHYSLSMIQYCRRNQIHPHIFYYTLFFKKMQ